MSSTSPTTAQNADFYQKNGYIRYENFFSAREIAGLRQAIDHAVDSRRARIKGAANDGRTSEDYEHVFNQMVNLWTDYPDAKQIAYHERLAESARRLSGCRHVRIYHDHAMIKPPGQTSKETNWHQDAPYWAMDPVGALSAWVTLNQVTANNGCLHFVPGSHKFGCLEAIALKVDGGSIVQKMTKTIQSSSLANGARSWMKC